MISDNKQYFAARAAKERRMATGSEDSKVRSIYQELATRYDELSTEEGQKHSNLMQRVREGASQCIISINIRL